MKCKHCLLSMKLIEEYDRFLCEKCQHSEPLIPPPPPSSNSSVKPLGRSTPFVCQACDSASQLKIGQVGKTEVCFCDVCSGFAIDRASFGDLVEYLRFRYEGPDNAPIALDQKQLQSQLQSNLACLACQDPMEMIVYCGPGNVVIATCETCKISWLKDGDLDQIVRAPGVRDYESKLPKYTMFRKGFLNSLTISTAHHR